MKYTILAAALFALAVSPANAATVVLPQVKNAGGASVASQASVHIDSSGVELGTVVLSAATLSAASVSGTGADQASHQARGLVLVVNTSAISGTAASLTVSIQGKDGVSGQYYTMLTSPAISTTGTTVLRIYPGLAASANATASDILPPVWRVSYAIAGTSPAVTATVGANLAL